MAGIPFTFDTNFDERARVAGADARARKSFSADEIDNMKADSYQTGQRSGEVRAAEALTRSVDQLVAHVIDALGLMDREVEAMRTEAAALAFACAKKLSGAALAHAPEDEIAEAMRTALHQAISETHVTVKTAPNLVHVLEARGSEIAHHEGYEGRLRFVGDPALRGADCRIEWRGGGMERAQQEIEHAIADVIQRRFTSELKE